MAPMRAAQVHSSVPFEADVVVLRTQYPEIGAEIDELRDALMLDYDLPEIPVDEDNAPGVYTIRLDYPPHGASGLSTPLMAHHGTDRTPGMNCPYRVITLLAIEDRRTWSVLQTW